MKRNISRNRVTIPGLTRVKKKYPDDRSACDFFEKMLWGEKPYCPKCGHKKFHHKGFTRVRNYKCLGCGKHFNCFTNTPLMQNCVSGIYKFIYLIYISETLNIGFFSTPQIAKAVKVVHPRTIDSMLERLAKMDSSVISAMYAEIMKPKPSFSKEKVFNSFRAKTNTKTNTKTISKEYTMLDPVEKIKRVKEIEACIEDIVPPGNNKLDEEVRNLIDLLNETIRAEWILYRREIEDQLRRK